MILYQEFSLKCDVLLLADVFEKFRNNSSDPDPQICIFSENSTRGGNSYIYNRYSKDDNKYLKSYDPKQKSKHIIYLDANNLCGYAMSKFLQTNVLKWIDPKEFDLNKYISNSSKRCVPEVDLQYPKELRELHSDYPLASDKIETKRNQNAV